MDCYTRCIFFWSFHEHALCMPLFCMARDLVCEFCLQRWLCCFLIARWLWCKAVALISQASVQFTEACEINQKCGQRPNGGDKADDTVGNRVGGSGGDQLAATRPTCCWSCWQSLYSYPHYGIPGTISPTIVAMFFGPKLARQGVGGCRDLPRWTIRLFLKALPAWTRDWNMSRSNVQWVRTSPWVPSEMPPFCWPLVNTMGTSMLWTRCPGIIAILTWGTCYMPGEYRNDARAPCSKHARAHCIDQRPAKWCHPQLWRRWSLCRQVCGVYGDADAAEKLGGRDIVRLAQFLRSSRLCRIFGTQIMGSRRWRWNGWDPLRLLF